MDAQLNTPTDPSEDINTSYSVGVSLAPSAVEFPAARLDDPVPEPISVMATYWGVDPDPELSGTNGVDIHEVRHEQNLFGLDGGVAIGALNSTGSLEVYVVTLALPNGGSGDYTDETLPLDVTYDGGSLSSVSTTVALSGRKIKVYAPATAEFSVNGTTGVTTWVTSMSVKPSRFPFRSPTARKAH